MVQKSTISPALMAEIHKVEDRSEILISWLQFGFIVMMSIIYAIAPKGFSDQMVAFRPVPIVLGIYLPLIVTRIVLSYLHEMHGYVLYISLVLDMIIITVLIWSFHIQYGEPPSLSLKAPTFIALLFFIILRSLRYDVGYIVTAGIMAILCWTTLLLYAILTGGFITHSFVEYAKSNAILVGAEVERMILLALSCVMLVIGVIRSRQLLAFSRQQSMAVRSLSHFFSPEVAQRIASSEDRFQPGKGEMRTAVSMEIDLRGFTNYSLKNDPDNVMKTLSDYQSRLIPIIMRNHGSIDKFLGDGILAHFGAVDDRPDFVANALRTVEDIIETFEQWNRLRTQSDQQNLRVGIGISYGSVLFGTIGDINRLEFTVIGNSVNSADKLQEHNKKLGTLFLTTQSTFDIAQQQKFIPKLTYRRFNDQSLTGFPDSVDLIGIDSHSGSD